MPDAPTLTDKFREMYDRSLNHGDFEPTHRMCLPDASFVGPNETVTGTQAVVELIRAQRAAFDDFLYEIEHIFANDEGVGVVSVTRGIHARPLFGVPASGQPVEIRMLSIHRVVDGRSTGGWTSSNYVEALKAALQRDSAPGAGESQASPSHQEEDASQ